MRQKQRPAPGTRGLTLIELVAAMALFALVAVMGGAFLLTGLLLKPPPGEVLAGLAVPSVPAGSSLLVLGLVGTTVVPYNLFLGSGIARGPRLGEARFGLAVAIVLGGRDSRSSDQLHRSRPGEQPLRSTRLRCRAAARR